MMTFLKRFLDGRSGATAVEYALLCALLALVLIPAITALTGSLMDVFGQVANATPQ